MTKDTKEPVTGLALLRVPFPDNQISKLPKETKKQREDREKDVKLGIRCQLCGGWHHRDAVHLDYVGHAALTDRLLDADPEWNWEPLSLTPEGQPATDRFGGMWIKLTVCDQTRLGYGHAEGKTGGDAVKEIIGDALRNAAMRFGAALDLWHKGDLHAEEPQSNNDFFRMIEELLSTVADKPSLNKMWKDNDPEFKKRLNREDEYPRMIALFKARGDEIEAAAKAQSDLESNPFGEDQ